MAENYKVRLMPITLEKAQEIDLDNIKLAIDEYKEEASCKIVKDSKNCLQTPIKDSITALKIAYAFQLLQKAVGMTTR